MLLLLTTMVNITSLTLVINNMANSTPMQMQGARSESEFSDSFKSYSATAVVNQYDSSILLVLCNDVESNPGPHSESFEKSLCDGLANLCRDAPSETVRSVLGGMEPNQAWE